MKAWVKGGLWGAGIGLIIYIIFLIISFIGDSGHPPLLILTLIPAMLFTIIFQISSPTTWIEKTPVFITSIIVSGIVVILATTIVGILIGFIVSKIKSENN